MGLSHCMDLRTTLVGSAINYVYSILLEEAASTVGNRQWAELLIERCLPIGGEG
jgi:hypothetical protein